MDLSIVSFLPLLFFPFGSLASSSSRTPDPLPTIDPSFYGDAFNPPDWVPMPELPVPPREITHEAFKDRNSVLKSCWGTRPGVLTPSEVRLALEDMYGNGGKSWAPFKVGHKREAYYYKHDIHSSEHIWYQCTQTCLQHAIKWGMGAAFCYIDRPNYAPSIPFLGDGYGILGYTDDRANICRIKKDKKMKKPEDHTCNWFCPEECHTGLVHYNEKCKRKCNAETKWGMSFLLRKNSNNKIWAYGLDEPQDVWNFQDIWKLEPDTNGIHPRCWSNGRRAIPMDNPDVGLPMINNGTDGPWTPPKVYKACSIVENGWKADDLPGGSNYPGQNDSDLPPANPVLGGTSEADQDKANAQQSSSALASASSASAAAASSSKAAESKSSLAPPKATTSEETTSKETSTMATPTTATTMKRSTLTYVA